MAMLAPCFGTVSRSSSILGRKHATGYVSTTWGRRPLIMPKIWTQNVRQPRSGEQQEEKPRRGVKGLNTSRS